MASRLLLLSSLLFLFVGPSLAFQPDSVDRFWDYVAGGNSTNIPARVRNDSRYNSTEDFGSVPGTVNGTFDETDDDPVPAASIEYPNVTTRFEEADNETSYSGNATDDKLPYEPEATSDFDWPPVAAKNYSEPPYGYNATEDLDPFEVEDPFDATRDYSESNTSSTFDYPFVSEALEEEDNATIYNTTKYPYPEEATEPRTWAPFPPPEPLETEGYQGVDNETFYNSSTVQYPFQPEEPQKVDGETQTDTSSNSHHFENLTVENLTVGNLIVLGNLYVKNFVPLNGIKSDDNKSIDFVPEPYHNETVEDFTVPFPVPEEETLKPEPYTEGPIKPETIEYDIWNWTTLPIETTEESTTLPSTETTTEEWTTTSTSTTTETAPEPTTSESTFETTTTYEETSTPTTSTTTSTTEETTSTSGQPSPDETSTTEETTPADFTGNNSVPIWPSLYQNNARSLYNKKEDEVKPVQQQPSEGQLEDTKREAPTKRKTKIDWVPEDFDYSNRQHKLHV